MNISDLQFKMILHELASIVGRDHMITSEADLTSYSVDIYWVPRMLIDRGKTPPLPDVVVVLGKSDVGRDYLVWDYAQSAVQRAVRTRDHLMIRTYENYGYRLDPVELYNIRRDPYMIDNLCQSYPEVVQHCDHLMMEWLQEQMAKPHAIVDPLQRVLEARKADAHK